MRPIAAIGTVGRGIIRSLFWSVPSIVRVIKSRGMRWAVHVARMAKGRGVYRVLVGRLAGKIPLGRHRRRWEDNIKMDLREIGIDGENWIQLAQNRVQWWACVNTVMNLRVPQESRILFDNLSDNQRFK
jgi:hypothetical protein